MGRPGPQTHAKRLRESQKRDKRRAKDERRAARKAAKNDTNAPAAQIGGGGATLKGESAP